MISIVRLSESGNKKFNTWFANVGREGVLAGAVEAELCDIMLDRVAAGESLVYELGQRYTNTGRPELLHLERADLDVSEIDDEDEE